SVQVFDSLFEMPPNQNSTMLADECFTYLPERDFMLFQMLIAKMVYFSSGSKSTAIDVALNLTFRATMEGARQELGKDLYPKDQWYTKQNLASAFLDLLVEYQTSQEPIRRALGKLLALRPAGHPCFDTLQGAGNKQAVASTLEPNPNSAGRFWGAILDWDDFMLAGLPFWSAPQEAFEAMAYWEDATWDTFDWSLAQSYTAEQWLNTVPGLKLTGTVWKDVDGDGILDVGEAGRGLETVFLDEAPFNGIADAGEAVASTAADGSFDFIGIPAATYRVRQDLDISQGWQLTSPSTGFHEVVGDPANPNQIFQGLDFGNLCPPGAPCDSGGGDGPPSVITPINDTMFLRSFRELGDGLIDLDTGIDSVDWVCGLVGQQSGPGDINETSSGDIIQTYLYRSAGSWRLVADFRSSGPHEWWHRLDVLCISSLEVAQGPVEIGKPFYYASYESLGDDIHFDTGMPTADWHCGVVGFAALDGKINANGTSHIMYAYAYPEAGNWHLRGEFRTRNAKPESWDMDMLCARTDLVAVGAPEADKPMLAKSFLDPPVENPVDTGVAKDDWVCGVTGMEIFSGDINENNDSSDPIIEAFLFEGTTNWMADLDFRTHGNHENWNLDILCHRRGVPTEVGTLAVTATPYFSPDYWVGLTAAWPSYPGAVEYRVSHFRQDACGSATSTVTTVGLSSSSGLHKNCGAPTDCYFKQATVEALSASGAVLAVGSDSFCEVGNPPLTVPGVPLGLFVNPGDGELTFNWEAPLDNGGAIITSYQYEVTPAGGVPIVGSTPIDAVSVSGLTNGTSHEVRVRAKNSVGFGPWTAPITGTPQGTVSVTATPYFSPDYWVGLTASWPAYPGASSYRVTHFRQDACSSGTSTVTTSGLSSSSGLHKNCGAPTECYFKQATVEVLNGAGSVMAVGSASFCEIGQPPALNLVATPYYGANYLVGLAATWDPIPGATSYRVTHYRQNACGSATSVKTVTGTSSGSGLHSNCGAPTECYFKQATVEALDVNGSVLATEMASICEIGFP
ncbi:MAG: fibronectin type III domain-containing protein, partial [Acidobacteria bacterium]|nr:fibronectin type III domain-containing protein [Acidobacteriota bacterium]